MSLPWQDYATEFWFSKVHHLPWSILLHSGRAYHPLNRFDILVADPLITLNTYGNTTIIDNNGSIQFSSEDPFALLDKILKDSELITATQPNPDLPFLGGAVGLFGYDLGRRLENIPIIAANDITLPDMAIGIYDWALIIDHHHESITLLSHKNLQTRLAWLKSQQSIITNNFSLTSPWSSNLSKKEYIKKFRQVQTYLKSGDCYQVNIAQRFQASYSGNEWQAFCLLNTKTRAPFSAFVRLEQGSILSISPERFIHLANGVIQTRPIKGTLPRLDDPYADQNQAKKLFNSPKNRSENLMIVDLLRNDLGRVAIPGSVQVPELFVVEQFPTVHHLVSTIVAFLPSHYSACDLLRASFPGGSITGAPKIRAMEIIEELEPHRRNAWCGSIGYLSVCGTMDTNIAIRTLITFKGQIYCSAGGGIVADSEENAEYQETLDKIYHIMKLLEG